MGIAFHKKFIGGVALAAILIAGVGAGPARAGDRDTERALAALLGLAVIGAIVADKKEDRARRADRVTRHDPVITHRDRVVIEPRPLPHRVSKRALPEHCMRVMRTNDGNRRVFGARCLTRNYAFVDQLPRSCERRVYTDRGPRNVYSAHCLRKSGFRTAGH